MKLMSLSLRWTLAYFWLLTTYSQSNYINSIYYLGSNMPHVYDFSNLDLKRATHILYAFAGIDGNRATINSTETVQDGKKVVTGHLGAIMKVKQNNRHIKTGLSILGDFGSMVPTAEGRSEFVASVIDIMIKFGFDFVDLDWEFLVRGFPKLGVKGNKDDPDYAIELLKEFHSQFKEKLKFRAFVTMAIPAPDYYLLVYKFKEMDPYIEYYNAMSYDYSGPFTSYAYHASNLYGKKDMLSVDTTMKRMLKAGIPSNKLVMGIPAYAIVFRDCKEKKLMSSYNLESSKRVGDLGYVGTTDLDWDKIEVNWDEEAQANWGWFEDQSMIISYESARAAELKMKYIVDNQLRGAMVWAVHQDYPIQDPRSLISVTTNYLGVDKLDRSQNNIQYPNSPYVNVQDPTFVVSSSLRSYSSPLVFSLLTVGSLLFLLA